MRLRSQNLRELDLEKRKLLRDFLKSMTALIAASLKVGKPIVF